MTPWEMYAGMANLVANGKDAWSSSTATADSLPWLSMVNPTDVSNVEAAMTTYVSQSYIPPEFASLQALTGSTRVTPQSAAAGYTAAVNFMDKYGNGVIGNGPYILTSYSASTSPAYLVLTKNPAFDWGNQISATAGAPAVLLNQQATIPGIVNPGQSITVTALQTVDGSTTSSPAPDATVTLQIMNGAVAYQTNMTTDSAGQATFTVPTSLPLGAYIVSLYTSTPSSALYDPLMQSVQLAAATATTTSTITTTSTTSSSSSSSIAIYPAIFGGLAIVTAVLIAAAALGSSRRRGYPRTSTGQLPQ